MACNKDSLVAHVEGLNLTEDKKDEILSLAGEHPNLWEGLSLSRAVRILGKKVANTPGTYFIS